MLINLKIFIIVDFGVSEIFDSNQIDKLNNTQGTYYFMSPEMLSSEAGQKGYSG
jgi:serine/threonine protein kinase